MPQDKDALTHALAFYTKIGAALFPIPAGSKNPTGLIQRFSWKFDFSRDPAQWQAWFNQFPGCNFGVVAFRSGLIIIDIDVVKYGPEVAWKTWNEVCALWGLPGPIYPHVISARGGWHVYLRVPEGIDPGLFRQPELIKGIIDIRTIGYTVAAGSYYDGTAKSEASGPYELLSDRDPEPAPQALLDLVRRKDPKNADGSIARPTALYEAGDVRKLVVWLRDDGGAFESYDQWIQTGMILRLEFGDDIGWEMWREATWQPPHPKAPTEDEMLKHWRSFETAPVPGNQTIRSLFLRAHEEGWKGGSIRLSWDAALDTINRTGRPPAEAYADATGKTVAAIAQNSGATLASGAPGGVAPIPPSFGASGEPDEQAITQGQRYAKQAEHWQSIVDLFLGASNLPHTPMIRDYPRIPEVAEHPLAEQMQYCVDRIIAFGEDKKTYRPERVNEILAVLKNVHAETFKAVIRKLRAIGCTIHERKINLCALGLWQDVESELRPVTNWITNVKGQIDTGLSDNVSIFLELIGVSVRWNAWLETAEVQGGDWSKWIYLDDVVFNALWSRANSRDIDYRVPVDFLWRTLLALARKNTVDPARDELDRLEALWDGAPRLHLWLSHVVGAPCDPYHQAVGRMIFGNLVRRIREPGCKCDFVPVFWGPQDTGKSKMLRGIAPIPEWFSDGVQLGDSQKELVRSLAGKAVVELAEMASRSGRESEHHKAMISAQVDEGRPAYERSVQRRPRRNIFIGTSNPEPLIDTSGNRRYLPIHVAGTINHEWFNANREQLIAEACILHSRGATFDLAAEVRAQAEQQREQARSVPRVEVELEYWLGRVDGF